MVGIDLWPVDPVAGAPSYAGENLRRTMAATMAGATAARPLGAFSGIRPGTPDSTGSVTSTAWQIGNHSGTLDLEANDVAGPYAYAVYQVQSGPLTAASGSFTRNDLVYLQFGDPAEGDGSAVPAVSFGYATGPADGSLALPALPNTRCIGYMQINVPRAGTGAPTSTWIAPYCAAAGAPVWVRSKAERDARFPSPPAKGLSVLRLDTGNLECGTGTAWNVFYPAGALESFGGTPLIGAYDPTKPIRKIGARKIGNSDAGSLTAPTLLPAGTTALLWVDLGMNLITGQTIDVRTDLSTLASVAFQLRNEASPYAALPNTQYDFNHTIWYQQ